MFNDYLANEEAKQHITRRLQEADEYRLHQRLGDEDPKLTRWIISLLMILILIVAFGLRF